MEFFEPGVDSYLSAGKKGHLGEQGWAKPASGFLYGCYTGLLLAVTILLQGSSKGLLVKDVL